MRETPLARQLAETPSPPSPLMAFEIARQLFVEGRRIEMQELAATLGVSRATLFRWVGGRDELMSEVVWSVTKPTFQKAQRKSSGHGGAFVAATMGRFSQAVIDSEFFGKWVHSEPERALRILTTNSTTFQSRLTAELEELLDHEVNAGRLALPLSLHDSAYLIVRISETFIYADMITGETPDSSKVSQAVNALLR